MTPSPRRANAATPTALFAAMHATLAPAILLASTLCAQGAEADQDLQILADEVAKAHRTDAAAEDIEAFAANLRIQETARDAANRIEIELQVQFMELAVDGRDRTIPLIRYKQIDSARTVEYGRDTSGYWGNLDGKAQYLTQKEFENDKQSVRRNLELARQMVRYLDPASVMRSLQDATKVREERLQIGRKIDEPCRTVGGRLDKFPLRQTEGQHTAVHVQLFVDAKGRLFGLEATPLGADGKPKIGSGEFLQFADYRELQGRMVPMRVRHYEVQPDGRRKQQIVVDITTLDLGKKLEADAFRKPD